MAISGTRLLIATCALAWPPVCAGAQVPSADAAIRFETSVRPVLYENCYACHGEKQQAGGLRLDGGAWLSKGASSGAVVVAGDPDHSRLVRAIRYTGTIKMPPGGKLTAPEIAAITEWVKGGAVWPTAPTTVLDPRAKLAKDRKFWSFQPVHEPKLPVVHDKSWVRSPIDAFVLARLEQRGLKPAPAADRRTLIRRASFDLTGLPPIPAEINSFLADKSPDAYAKVIDRLLASPRYGERWGRHWLDIVRYADSADARGLGSEGDISEAWRYRDWVVNAFNSDMPYSRFMMNQVAGDLLTAPGVAPGDINVRGTIATGMLAIGNWGNGDADKDKILTDIADDQVDVVSRGFMGLTVACARCHDHKFDPIPTKDYYGLAGIFFSTHILPKLTPKGAGENMLRIPLETKVQKEVRDRITASVDQASANLKRIRAAAQSEYARTELMETARYVEAAWEYGRGPSAHETESQFAARKGLAPPALRSWRGYLGLDDDYRLLTQTVRDVGGVSGVQGWRGMADCPNVAVNTTDKPVSILTFMLPPRSVSVHPGPANGVAVTWTSPIKGTVRISGGVTDADPAGGDGIAWIIDHRSAGGPDQMAAGDFPNGGSQLFAQGKGADRLSTVAVDVGDRIQLLVLPKASYTCDTTVVDLDIRQADGTRRWNLAKDLMDDPLKANPRPDSYGDPATWSFQDMAASSRAVQHPGPALDPALAALMKGLCAAADPGAAHTAAAAFAAKYAAFDPQSPFYVAAAQDDSVLPGPTRAEMARLAGDLDKLKKSAPMPAGFANGAQEGGVPESPHAGIHDVRVHIRGRYDRLADLVARHFPIILAGLDQPPITQGSGRLQLAQWLASDTHPLTSGVIVNRMWQQHFGAGIVRTPSNFGFLGERPTHPELLDWLADHFVHDGWSIKRIHRLIMLSSTYRQSSDGAPMTERADPDNRLFGRMNRRRLEAEAVRDSLLAVAGSLDTTMGGVANRDFNAPRRTLYIMTIRSDRSGYGPLFDAADPTSSVDRRTVSTVAPQALFLLNSSFALDQAKRTAERLLHDDPHDARSRIERAYELLYGRPASSQEVSIGMAFLGRSGRGASVRTVAVGGESAELRAWAEYSQVLLCANEFMYVD